MRSSLSVSLAQNVGVSGPMILDLNQNIIDLILSQNDHLSVVGVENQHLKVHSRGRDLEEVKYFWNFNLNWIWWWLADSAILHCALYHLSIWELWVWAWEGWAQPGQAQPQEIGLSCSPRSNQVSLKLNYHHLFIQPDKSQINHVCLRK